MPISAQIAPRSRNHQMDLLRIAFASCVILSHAPEVTDGNRSRELLYCLTHVYTFGMLGVDGFFLLSGYLILKSWMAGPSLREYLPKRMLRIVPGYLVAALLSTAVLGVVAPEVPHFFRHLTVRFPISLLLLSSPATPFVCPGLDLPVDGALYTINYEFRCYLLVALFGLAGLLRYRYLWLMGAIACLAIHFNARLSSMFYFHSFYLITGEPQLVYRMTGVFLTGGCFYLFRDKVFFAPWLAAVSMLSMVAARLFVQQLQEPALIVGGGYLLFYLVSLRMPSLRWMERFPDISYGLYLYGWPVEILWIWYFRGSPWITFAAAMVICSTLGWLSWHYVERPMLALKPRPSAPLTV
jgi:peptidoglycan/LPS O-acetylase OafA/YrhL